MLKELNFSCFSFHYPSKNFYLISQKMRNSFNAFSIETSLFSEVAGNAPSQHHPFQGNILYNLSEKVKKKIDKNRILSKNTYKPPVFVRPIAIFVNY